MHAYAASPTAAVTTCTSLPPTRAGSTYHQVLADGLELALCVPVHIGTTGVGLREEVVVVFYIRVCIALGF